jgi:exodeoxyribonuclease VII small subunit
MPSRSKSTPAPADSSGVTFEDALAELEEIIQDLDGGPAALDELVLKYERGMGLLKTCQQQLDVAQLRIEQIARRADGAAEISPLTSPPAGAAPAAPVPPASPPSSSDDEIRLF